MISDIVRAAPTNMFMIYGQAVEHLAMIFRPAQLGYMFLDQGSGLAFFWVSRLVVLFLISFEFAQKILSAKRSVSLLYAVMVTFSPLAQWWWAVNFIAEILAAAGFLWCAGIYILSMYPAWQVPFGWTFLLCMIAATVASDNVSQVLRRDKIFWLVGVQLCGNLSVRGTADESARRNFNRHDVVNRHDDQSDCSRRRRD